MFWDKARSKMNKAGRAALGAALLVGGVTILTAPAMAQSVVVRSTGPSASQYPAGKKLPSNARLTLKSGDVITVLDKGGTRVLRGPRTISLNQRVASASTTSSMRTLLRTRSNTRARTGAVRSTGTAAAGEANTAPRSPNLWFVDVSRPGTYCIADPAGTVLWRSDIAATQSATLSDASGAGATPIEWRRGSALKRWPMDKMPIADGGIYTLAMAGDAEPAQITLRLMETVPEDADDTASELIARGCQQQLDLLVDTLQTSENTGAAGEAEPL
ncbi:hypothetical protein [Alterisphingorhabdus coralli]|uniref:Uncharacterized protein n=1 Tax=Alterisphingorhabdus coralli TaxID=3071408 RepID=A0AA97I0Z5_9SPHN|nr:hypothetical protein [Parasphingorhabdus sp. SCSIO 66989]WOE74730.1 hypothetical protein RB602_12890 [Parasphingorhabdus sp. SCSIO 66989]